MRDPASPHAAPRDTSLFGPGPFGPLDRLRDQYGKQYDIELERRWPGKPRYIALARDLGTSPHCVITADPDELAEHLGGAA